MHQAGISPALFVIICLSCAPTLIPFGFMGVDRQKFTAAKMS